MKSPEKSESLFKRAQAVIPGGVDSPVRAFGGVGGTPRFIAKGEGCQIVDVDGNKYIDFCMSWGPLILGHAHPKVIDAIQSAIKKGTSFGAPTEAEVLLAEKLCRWVGPVDQVRFVSSGTEATMSAIRLARGYTERDLIIKFAGCYHGHADYLLVQAGSGLATFGTPTSSGVPADVAKSTLVAKYNSLDSVKTYFENFKDQIACVIVEPIPANSGLILPEQGFLQGLIDLCHEHGALVIFDEVITGFRVSRAGVAGKYGLTPDLMTFGKVIGGGLPVGAFGGNKKIMQKIAPLGSVYQAGTLSGNPVAMMAGLATLEVLESENAYSQLEKRGAAFESMLREAITLEDHGVAMNRVGSIFWFCLGGKQCPTDPSAIAPQSAARYRELFHHALDNGIYLAPSGFEVGFIGLAHGESDLKRAVEVLADGIRRLPPLEQSA
ncbi:MAG: glutamate-1-semialdehyde 2,1-aminomutase [candidate division Zixibacteria bacterium]|nr:glutamate-1-semialdehyde 2,1-aminomutase [candidate division Zixibacteria bacterium]